MIIPTRTHIHRHKTHTQHMTHHINDTTSHFPHDTQDTNTHTLTQLHVRHELHTM